MESNHIEYDFLASVERIDEIISTSDSSFEELESIPTRDKLTFTNGFYVNCSALFVDIRKSSELPDKHTRPKLAKLYRVYISEAIAVMNGDTNCAEISVVGDCVSGIFNTPYQKDINSTFETAGKISSLLKIMNHEFNKNGIEQIEIGVGVSFGRALMVKAGYKGSGINDVVWMGEVVNEASKLASYGNETYSDKETMVSTVFYNNLKEEYQKLLELNITRNCYHGYIIDIEMNKWYETNCLKK